eukprot:2035009-Pleurochrysis_carterae.AAC.1
MCNFIRMHIGLNVITLLDADRRRRTRSPLLTVRSVLSNVLYILKIWKHSWGYNLVVEIGTRQLFLLQGTAGARGGGIETRYTWFVPGKGVMIRRISAILRM